MSHYKPLPSLLYFLVLTTDTSSELNTLFNHSLSVRIIHHVVAKSGVPSFQGQEIAARTEVTKIMDMIREQNKSKEINIVVECMVGNIRDTIQYMIKMYEPAMLVVGTRGRNTVKGFLLGSVSRYCLNHSPIPVTVVRPASKLKESKTKAKGIFRRRNSAVQVDMDDGTGDSPPKLFYSSPLSRETSRTSSLESSNTITSIELERRESRSPDRNSQHYHHQHQTAAAKASAAKRSVLFPPVSAPSSLSPAPSSALNSAAAMMIPPSPAASINTSLSYASAMLSSSPPGTSSKPPPPPEGAIRMTKSMTSDGTTGPSASNKRIGGRISFPKLSGSISLGPLSLGGSKDKDKDKEKKGSFLS
ncbi:hypothetical protein BGZ98_007772 [Dissophora globulifera]|nr:hypothetical protein BGZ98_007772 [Dissophora globulifera]